MGSFPPATVARALRDAQLSLRRPRCDLPFDAPAKCPICHIQVVADLKVDPKFRRGPEITGQTKCRVRGNPATTKHDVVDPRSGDFDSLCEGIDADFHRIEKIVAQNFAWMDEWKPFAGSYLGKVNPARIQILAFDAHGFIPSGSPRPRRSTRCRCAIRSISAIDR